MNFDHSPNKPNEPDDPLQQISPSPFQHRKHFDEEKLKELAASIQREGLIEPIGVRPNGGRYQFQDTLPPGNSSDTFGAIKASISPELVDESHIRTGVVNFGLVEMLK